MSPSLPARGLLGLILLYKWTLSPLIGRQCRYLPTCSSYAVDAIRRHGAWAGGWVAAARFCRCHPWGGHGWDPAPESVRANSWWRPWRYGDWKGGYRPPPQHASPLAGEAPPQAAEGGRAEQNAMAPLASSPERPPPPTPPRKGAGSRDV